MEIPEQLPAPERDAAKTDDTVVTAARTETLPDNSALWQTTLNWQPSEQQQQQFQQLYTLLLAGNRQFNLTRITTPEEFWEKHLWDSLRGIQRFLTLSDTAPAHSTGPIVPSAPLYSVIDIGTGGGFPGVPVAIARPDWTVTLLDATRKKMNFLADTVAAMGLEHTHTLIDRAETVGQQSQHRQRYDLALIRAVAAASVCAEYTLPLLKVGGMAVLYRGQWTEAEQVALIGAIAQLGGTIDAIEAFTTPLTHSIRHCIYVKKVAPTPAEFPRIVGLPAQKPL